MMKRFEIWAIGDNPPSDGSWDGWTKLGSYENYADRDHNGAPYTQEEIDDWESGLTVEFDDSNEYRYIRIKCLEIFWGASRSGSVNMNFAEVTFWGLTED